MRRENVIVTTVALLLFTLVFGRNLTAAPQAIPRNADPVIITGDMLTDFIGVPVTDVVAYSYNGSWQPIPFQIDEKTIEPGDTEPDFVRFEDGLIDADDELVFMAADAGVAQPSWPTDAQAAMHPRANIVIVDPLAAVSGSVYLYRSTTLARSTTSYVTLDLGTETVTAISYTVGFNSAQFLGIDRLFLNGESADLIDRQKLRATAGVGPIEFVQNEEDVAGQFDPFTSIVTGPVRLVEGGDTGLAFYAQRFDVAFALNIEDLNAQLPFGATIRDVRISLDHNNSATTGVSSYADSNGASTAIDGLPDAAVTDALRDWYQVNGGALGGLAVTFPQIVLDGGTLTTYYSDNASPTDDTGDMQQFADTGLFADNPSGDFAYQQTAYVLPPNTATVVGATYFQQATTPLSATVTSETDTPTAVTVGQASHAHPTGLTLLVLIALIVSLISTAYACVSSGRLTAKEG